MKRCLILTGGKLSLAFAGSFLKEHKFEKVVAVDGGLEAAKELDIIPDVIVGDFDRRKTGSYDREYPSAVSMPAKRYLCRDRRLPEPSVSDRRGAYLPKGRDLGKVYLFPAPYRRSKGDHVKRL